MAKRKVQRLPRTLTAESRRELVRFYSDATRQLADLVLSTQVLDSARPRFGALLQGTDRILGQLDRKAQRWARENVRKIYQGNLQWVDGQIVGAGIPEGFGVSVGERAGFAQIHEDAIADLVTNPTTGMGPRLERLSAKMRQDVKGYASAHKRLTGQLRKTNRLIAQGVLRGASPAETRNLILRAIQNDAPADLFGLARYQAGGPGGALKTLAEAPYLLKSNGARIHVMDHIQMLVNTKQAQIQTKARNLRLIESGLDLARISPNPPLTPDACALYAGRIVALTTEAAKHTGFPLIDRLPGGGPPFHPNCTHTTIPWFGDLESAEDQVLTQATGEKKTKTHKGGLPKAALDREWKDAQKWSRQRGGIEFAVRQNPQLLKQSASRLADESGKEARVGNPGKPASNAMRKATKKARDPKRASSRAVNPTVLGG